MGAIINPYRFGGLGSPDANTTFLCRFNTSTPTDEVTSSTGTLVGNAVCDTGNSRVTLDGTGDWVTFADQTAFRLAGASPFTFEVHSDQAAGQVGGLIGRGTSGTGRYVWYSNGDGTIDLYASGGIIVRIATGMDGSDHHLALAFDGTTIWGYKDGVNVASALLFSGFGDAALTLYIGTDPFDTTGRDIASHIGRVKISNICRYPSGTTFTPPARADT